MPAPIRVDSEFRTHRREARGPLAFEHRESYLGFVLGMVATVVVALAGLGYWTVQAGLLDK